MINSGVFNYINVLDKGADASWLRGKAINNNIANGDTPFYKRQDVAFEDTLEKALKSTRSSNLGKRVANISLKRLDVGTYTDSVNYSYRIDGNNVDPEMEQVELAANTQKYNGIMDSMTAEFARLRSVMK